MYEKYTHHGTEVTVRKDLKGKHREYCLCYTCEVFKDGTIVSRGGCPTAKALYENCIKYGVVTPVFECPDFKEVQL
jgi:hypothetical protein